MSKAGFGSPKTVKAMPSRGTRTTKHVDNYQAQDDMHTLRRAAEITSDTSRHKAAKTEAAQHVKAFEKVFKK